MSSENSSSYPTPEDLYARKSMYTDPVTGAQKEQGLVRPGLLPPEALAYVAAVFGWGATKYDDNNWRKGYPWSLSIDALERHLMKFKAGEDLDLESELPHMAHVAWHALVLLQYALDHPLLDDRWHR